MLDIRLIREQPDLVRRGLVAKHVDPADLDAILELDRQLRELIGETDALKMQRNQASEAIASLKRKGEDFTTAVGQTRELGDRLKTLQVRLDELEAAVQARLLVLPNLPHASVPSGAGAPDNVVASTWGEKPEFAFPLKDHVEIGERLGLFDFKRGAKISGRGFPVFTGNGALLERALISYFLDLHLDQHGFTEIAPPYLVNRQSMIGTGQLPKFEEDMYRCGDDDLFLIPTAEVPVTNYHAGEVLREDELPISYAAYSACFRREAGSWGKETRGFHRLHQFDKVEMVKFTTPAASYDALEELRGYAEEVLRGLGLHYRVLSLCTGDLSFGAAKCYDLEVWAPAAGRWLEVSSVSNFEDFQARRANIRVKQAGRMSFVHTLNGSGVATPRLLVALLETFQTPEGWVRLPEALWPYMKGKRELRPAV